MIKFSLFPVINISWKNSQKFYDLRNSLNYFKSLAINIPLLCLFIPTYSLTNLLTLSETSAKKKQSEHITTHVCIDKHILFCKRNTSKS